MSLKPEYGIKLSEFTGSCFAGWNKKKLGAQFKL